MKKKIDVIAVAYIFLFLILYGFLIPYIPKSDAYQFAFLIFFFVGLSAPFWAFYPIYKYFHTKQAKVDFKESVTVSAEKEEIHSRWLSDTEREHLVKQIKKSESIWNYFHHYRKVVAQFIRLALGACLICAAYVSYLAGKDEGLLVAITIFVFIFLLYLAVVLVMYGSLFVVAFIKSWMASSALYSDFRSPVVQIQGKMTLDATYAVTGFYQFGIRSKEFKVSGQTLYGILKYKNAFKYSQTVGRFGINPVDMKEVIQYMANHGPKNGEHWRIEYLPRTRTILHMERM